MMKPCIAIRKAGQTVAQPTGARILTQHLGLPGLTRNPWVQTERVVHVA